MFSTGVNSKSYKLEGRIEFGEGGETKNKGKKPKVSLSTMTC